MNLQVINHLSRVWGLSSADASVFIAFYLRQAIVDSCEPSRLAVC